jgi:membrane protein
MIKRQPWAALAYYTVFSLASLLLIAIAIAGLVLGREAAQGQILDQLRECEAGDRSCCDHNGGRGAAYWCIGCGQSQTSLNTIWEVTTKA